jgi:hypothetical protein
VDKNYRRDFRADLEPLRQRHIPGLPPGFGLPLILLKYSAKVQHCTFPEYLRHFCVSNVQNATTTS